MVDAYRLEYRDEFPLSFHMHWYKFVKVHHSRSISVPAYSCMCLSLVDDCGAVYSYGNGSCFHQAKSHYKIAAQLKQQTAHIVDILYNVSKLSFEFILSIDMIVYCF